MTITLTYKTGKFDPFTRDQASLYRKLALAFLGVGTAAERATAQAEVLRKPDFTAEVQSTTDSSNLQAVDLTDEGVTFPANTIREITLKSSCMSDNDHYYYESAESVLGGTTPKLMGQRIQSGWNNENGTVSEYGRVHFKGTITALTTITTVFSSKGLQLGDITSGNAPFTVPKNRLCLVKAHNLSQPSALTATAAAGNVMVIDTTNLDGAGTGTDAVSFFAVSSATTSVVAASPALGGDVDIAFEIWPPHNHRLVMNSNNVEVQVTAVAAIGDQNLKHVVDVFVGAAKKLDFSAV